MRSILPILLAVLFTIACGAPAQRTRIEIPMVESWVSHPQLLIMQIPPPPETFGGLVRLRLSLLHRSSEIRFRAFGTSPFEPIVPGAVSETPWLMRLQPRLVVNVARFIAEGHVGVAPIAPSGQMLHIVTCPEDLLLAGYFEARGERLTILRTTPEQIADPEYGCLFRLSRRP